MPDFDLPVPAGQSASDTVPDVPAEHLADSPVSDWERQLHDQAHRGAEAIPLADLSPPIHNEKSMDAPITSFDTNRSTQDAQAYNKNISNVVDVTNKFEAGVTQYASNPSFMHPSAELARWEKRSDDAHSISQAMGFTPEEGMVHAYMLGEHPVALMQLENTSPAAKLSLLATHPGTSGGGEAMVEKAVNQSQKLGRNGKLVLDRKNEASTDFYKSVGFIPAAEGPTMHLDPKDNKLWIKNDGKWRLSKHGGKPHLTTIPTKGRSA